MCVKPTSDPGSLNIFSLKDDLSADELSASNDNLSEAGGATKVSPEEYFTLFVCINMLLTLCPYVSASCFIL